MRPARGLKLALFGFPVGHSRSADLFDGLDLPCGRTVHYSARGIEPGRLAEALDTVRSGALDGANVTVPHKRTAGTIVDRLVGSAGRVGAVNVIVREAGGTLAGANTDGDGFLESLALLPGEEVRRALILGAGGAARAVEHALTSRGVAVTLVSRRPDSVVPVESGTRVVSWDDEELEERTRQSDLVVQATPLGMPPFERSVPPLSPRALRTGHRVVDLVYEPWETRFLAHARARGARAVNGWPMLVGQAAAALELWAGAGAAPALRARASAVETRDPSRA